MAKLLKKAGYVAFRRGGKQHGGLRPGLVSLVIPTDKLVALWEEQVSLEPFRIVDDQTAELVLLKDADKSLLDYPETEFTMREHALLRCMNGINQSLPWSYVHRTGERRRLHPLALTLRRGFREGRFDRGGRMHCGAQGLTRGERATVEIGGQETVELDFQGMSAARPYLLLRDKQRELRDAIQEELRRDPFEVEGHSRDVIKAAVNIALNTKSQRAAVSSLRKEFRRSSMTLAEARAAVAATVKRHPLISDYFFQCRDGELEYVEAAIMHGVIQAFAEKGLPVLPIHDGLLCREADASYAEEMMREMVEWNHDLELVICRKS